MPTNQKLRSISPINQDFWAFSIGGLVRHPLIFSLADLMRQPSVTLPVSIICTDQRSIDTTNYTGVRLSTLLDQVEIDSSAITALIHAYDGYSTILPLDTFRDHAVIAYAIDGQPLTHDQGFPARLVIPGRFGYKMPKWTTRIELTDTEQGGFWEGKPGFTLYGDLFMVSEITGHERLSDGSIRIAGFVYARPGYTPRLLMSIDESAWTPIPYDPAQTQWQVDWTPPYPNGGFNVRVRALDDQSRTAATSRRYTIRT